MPKPKLLLSVFVFLLVAAGVVSAQTVSIVSGQGQVSCPICSQFEPLVVKVVDANNVPLPNVTVTWTVTGEGVITGGAKTLTTVTDGAGLSQVTFFQQVPVFQGQLPYYASTVAATVGASTVVFYETTATVSVSGGQNVLGISPSLQAPTVGATLTGQSGTTSPAAVQVFIGAPNVSVRLVSLGSTTPAANVSCQTSPGQPAGLLLSDSAGNATCNVVFGSAHGEAQFDILIGEGYQRYTGFTAVVTAGLPCIMRIDSGNNQSANAGQALFSPLVAVVTDCGGAPLEGVTVTWGPISPANGATLTNARTSTDANGRVSANATLGSIPGDITIPIGVAAGTQTADNRIVSASFTARVNVTISGFTKVSGDNQDAAQNTQFAQPLTVRATNAAGQGIANLTVNFAITGGTGSATLSSATAVTNAAGDASVTVNAGATAGSVVVTASTGLSSATFNLNVRPPGPSNITFSNFASGSEFVAPCSVAVMRGSGIASGIQGAVVPVYFGPWSQLVSGLSIQFVTPSGSVFAPIYSVSNIGGQQSATFQVPCEAAPGNVQVVVRANAVSANFTAQVQAVSPGILESTQSDGRLRAVIVKPDGSWASLENPVRRGEVVRMYITGVGNNVVPQVGTNSPGYPDGDSTVTDLSAVIVGVNNAGVRVVSAKYARDLIGIYEIAFQVPSDAPTGSLNLAVAIAGVFGNNSQIAIQ
jgi:uncharacterized protein (TIGR03437 family)